MALGRGDALADEETGHLCGGPAPGDDIQSVDSPRRESSEADPETTTLTQKEQEVAIRKVPRRGIVPSPCSRMISGIDMLPEENDQFFLAALCSAGAQRMHATRLAIEANKNFQSRRTALTMFQVFRHLLPWLYLGALLSYLDRGNLSYAALQLNADLGACPFPLFFWMCAVLLKVVPF